MTFEPPIDALRQRVRSLYRDAHTTPQNPVLLLRACEELQTALDILQTVRTTVQEQAETLAEQHTKRAIEHDDYQSLFVFAPDAYLVTSLDGTIHKANQAALTLFNQAGHELVGRPFGMFVPEGERRAFRAALTEMLTTEHKQDWRLRLQRPTGVSYIASINVVRVCNTLQRPIALRWQIRDVTQQQSATVEQQKRLDALEHHVEALEQHSHTVEVSAGAPRDARVLNDIALFLIEAMVISALATDVSTLTSVAQLAVPRFADLCVVDYVPVDGSTERVNVLLADAHQQTLARELRRGAPATLRIGTGTPLLYTNTLNQQRTIGNAWIDYVARDQRQAQALQTLVPTSALIVPLHHDNKVFGQLVFVSTTPERRYTQYEQAFASVIANRIALALTPARTQHLHDRVVGE